VTRARGEQVPETTPERAASPRARRPSPGQRYGLLLLLLVATYLFSAFATGLVVSLVQTVVFVGTLLLALRNSLVSSRTARLIGTAVLAGTVIMVALLLAQPSGILVGLAEIWTGLILLATVATILRRIVASTTVTLQSIYGALAAYMIIGLMFAAFYGAMSRLGAGTFFAGGSPGNTKTFQYFSFTTLTTLGYGDFTAASNAGRAVAVMEAMTGQIFLATLVARLVAAFRPPGSRD
jgi:hypothetical protein